MDSSMKALSKKSEETIVRFFGTKNFLYLIMLYDRKIFVQWKIETRRCFRVLLVTFCQQIHHNEICLCHFNDVKYLKSEKMFSYNSHLPHQWKVFKFLTSKSGFGIDSSMIRALWKCFPASKYSSVDWCFIMKNVLILLNSVYVICGKLSKPANGAKRWSKRIFSLSKTGNGWGIRSSFVKPANALKYPLNILLNDWLSTSSR